MFTNTQDYYWFFNNALSSDTCDKIIELGLSKKTFLARTHGYSYDQFKDLNKNQKNNLKKIRNSNICFLDDKWLMSILNNFVVKANINSGWKYQIDYSERIQFTKYKKNQHYGFHADSSVKDIDSYGKIRKLSLVACLSDPKEFKGGDFEFQFRNNEDPTIITPVPELRNKGTVIVFPSFLYHRVTPLTKGTRYSLVMWTRGNFYW